jgi:hypothetical protein
VQSEPDELSLDPEQFDFLRRDLKRAGIASLKTVETLARAVAATMSAYRAGNAESDGTPTFREKHDVLRELWRLVERPDPLIGQIRARLRGLPAEALAHIEERAERRWLVYFAEPAPTPSHGWLAEVPAEELLKILPPSISCGGMMVTGRRRESGRRSRARFEPMVLGVVRGSRPCSKQATVEGANRTEVGAMSNGRPRDDAALQLISFLAVDWTLATEQRPVQGRSDKTPFGDLVHQVFGWLERPDATGALRRYWREWRQRAARDRLNITQPI